MFCSQCGGKLLDEAKFCSSCGLGVADASKAVSANPILPPTNVDAKDLLKNHKSIGEEYANVPWVIKQLSKQKKVKDWSKQKALLRFEGSPKPNGAKMELIIAENFIAILTPFSFMSNQWASSIIFPREEIKMLQIGTASHVQHMGLGATVGDYWVINLITQAAGIGTKTLSASEAFKTGYQSAGTNYANGEYPTYLSLGQTNYQMNEYISLYEQKTMYLANFWPVSLDGGHVNTSGVFKQHLELVSGKNSKRLFHAIYLSPEHY